MLLAAVAGEQIVGPVQTEAELVHQVGAKRRDEIQRAVVALLAGRDAADAGNNLIQRIAVGEAVVDVAGG